MIPLNDYGCRVLTPAERMEIYLRRRGDGDEILERIARGIKIKRRLLAELRNIAARKASGNVFVRKHKLTLAR